MTNKEKFIESYLPLLDSFCKEITGISYKGMPEPFFPVFGKNYEGATPKILFVGMETSGWLNMQEFMRLHISDNSACLFRIQPDFDDQICTKWTNNFGSSFWDFIFRFLAKIHDLDNWKELKQGKKPEIINSFGWANVNSVERFEVSCLKNKVERENWEVIKNASERFDLAKLIIDSMSPEVIILTHWNAKEAWFDDLIMGEWVILSDHLWYNKIQPSNTHIFWTAHPRWLFSQIGFEKIIDDILITLCEKDINLDFPGKNIIDIKADKRILLNNLKKEINILGEQLKLEITFSPNQLGEKYSGFYFKRTDWQEYLIGFEFDDYFAKDLYYGICKIKSDNDDNNIRHKEIQALIKGDGVTHSWPVWWYANSDIFSQIENRNFTETIKATLISVIALIDKNELKL